MKLRAHHLLCLQGFRGLGYSPQFIRRMKKVVEKINSQSDLAIELTDGVDVICEACPHNVEGECQKEPLAEKSVKRRDRQVLKILELKNGVSLQNKFLFSLLRKKASKIDLQELCATCEWLSLGYCQKSLENLTLFS